MTLQCGSGYPLRQLLDRLTALIALCNLPLLHHCALGLPHDRPSRRPAKCTSLEYANELAEHFAQLTRMTPSHNSEARPSCAAAWQWCSAVVNHDQVGYVPPPRVLAGSWKQN